MKRVTGIGGVFFKAKDPPSASSFMVDYRVEDLHGLLAKLREEACDVVGDVEESEYGKFG